MHWLIDLTAASDATPGLNTWALGLLRGLSQIDTFDDNMPASRFATEHVPDRWTIAGNRRLPASIREYAVKCGVRVVRLPGPRLPAQHLGLPVLARRLRVDGLLAASTVLPLVPGGPPAVSVLHDFRHRDEPHRYGRVQRGYRNTLYRRAVRTAGGLVAISEATAVAAAREDPDAAARIVVARHGSDHVLDWPHPVRGTHVIAFGHWPNKEPRIALEAWAAADPECTQGRTLHIVGLAKAERDALEALARERDVAERVRLHGPIEDAEFRELFASAAVLLFPSSAEGLGLPVLEAMRLGVAVAASSLPAIREVAGDAAWYAEPGDVDGFASAITEAVRAPAAALAAAGERAEGYTWRACAQVFRDALHRVVVHRVAVHPVARP